MPPKSERKGWEPPQPPQQNKVLTGVRGKQGGATGSPISGGGGGAARLCWALLRPPLPHQDPLWVGKQSPPSLAEPQLKQLA